MKELQIISSTGAENLKVNEDGVEGRVELVKWRMESCGDRSS